MEEGIDKEKMKECLIIGPATALQYKNVYPLLIKKAITVTERAIHFYKGKKDQRCYWFTTFPRFVDMSRRKLTKIFNKNDYPTYDNAPDIIECNNKSNIPIDYQGEIGVPITFLCYYPELDYEILEKLGDLKLNGKSVFERLIIKKK